MFDELKDDWRRMIATLPEEPFFQVINTWVGPVKTPFKKAPYVDKLIQLISNPDNIHCICRLLDPLDRSLLSAVYYLKGITPKQIHELTCPHLSHLQFSFKILNLEQRLLIYRLTEKGQTAIAINPFWLEAFQQSILSLDSVFKPLEVHKENSAIPWLEPDLLYSFLSFALEKEPSLKQDWTWKKKSQEKIGELFPVLETNLTGIDRKEWLKGILLSLSCLSVSNENLYMNESGWKSLVEWSPNERYLATATAALYWLQHQPSPEALRGEGTPFAPISESLLQEGIFFFVNLLKALPHGNFYSKTDWVQILKLCAPSGLIHNPETALNALIEMQLLITRHHHSIGINPIFDTETPLPPPNDTLPHAIIESSFDLILKPETSFREGCFIALIADLTHFDHYKRFTITKDSFLRSVQRGLTPAFIIQRLEAITGQPLPLNLAQNLEQWGDNYHRIRIIEGILLQISEKDAPLFQSSPDFNRYVIQALTPTLFLMDEDSVDEWEAQLLKIGIQEIPVRERPGKKSADPVLFNTLSLTPPSSPIRAHQPLTQTVAPISPEESPNYPAMQQRIRELALTPGEQEAVQARIHNRICLFPEQIARTNGPFKIREASGLNVSGKISVIKKAIENRQEILEIIPLSLNPNVSSELVFPVRLSKTGTSYLLEGQKIETNEAVLLPVNQIATVKRFSSSLFGS